MLINAKNRKKNNAVRRFLLNDYTDWRELFIETIPSARSRFDWTKRGARARALRTRCNDIYCAYGTTQTSSDRITLTRFYCGHCFGAMQATPKHQLKASRARDNFLFPQRNEKAYQENQTPDARSISMFDVWLLIKINVFIVKIGRTDAAETRPDRAIIFIVTDSAARAKHLLFDRSGRVTTSCICSMLSARAPLRSAANLIAIRAQPELEQSVGSCSARKSIVDAAFCLYQKIIRTPGRRNSGERVSAMSFIYIKRKTLANYRVH